MNQEDFEHLEDEVRDHHREQFGPKSVKDVMLKFQEESGELAGALTRHIERRKKPVEVEPEGSDDWTEEIQKEMEDVLTALIALVVRFPQLFGHRSFFSIVLHAMRRFLSRSWENLEPTRNRELVDDPLTEKEKRDFEEDHPGPAVAIYNPLLSGACKICGKYRSEHTKHAGVLYCPRDRFA